MSLPARDGFATEGADFEYIQKVVYECSGIVLDANKRYLVDSRLLPVARSRGVSSLAELVALLRGPASKELHRTVIEAMTTNETSFFRDVHPFNALRDTILPELVERKAATRTLSIWSAACSSGQEPYTIAILLKEHFPELLSGWKVRILATDLSQEILDKAAEGKYSQFEVNRGLPAAMLTKYFAQDGLSWKLSDDIRRLIEFRQMNLCGPWPIVGPMDVVFLRNVLIYFDVETKSKILRQVRSALAPGGYLFLGSAETTLNLDDGFERVMMGKSACYRDR